MMLILPDVLAPDEVQRMREQLLAAQWHDGRETAGHTAFRQKRNRQLRANDPLAVALGERILARLAGDPRYLSFVLPLRIMPPFFNRYGADETYGFHVDNAIRVDPVSGDRIRTDVSTTVFLSDPQEYEGGELVIQDTYGMRGVKLPAGHAVLYPGTSLHQVAPVTQGERFAAFFWSQSMVNDDGRRSLLYELDSTIQQLAGRGDVPDEVLRLTGVYHNLIRQWAQT